MSASYRRIGAVALAIDIMKYLGSNPGGASHQDISEAMGTSRDIIMRQLLTLEGGGFVQRNGDLWEVGIYIGVFWMNIKIAREKTIDSARADLARIGAQ